MNKGVQDWEEKSFCFAFTCLGFDKGLRSLLAWGLVYFGIHKGRVTVYENGYG